MKKYIYRNRHSWEKHPFVRHLMIDKMELVNETEYHWEQKGSDGIVRAISKHFEKGRIHHSLADMFPAALKVAEEEIEILRRYLRELEKRPRDDQYFMRYPPGGKPAHLNAHRGYIQVAIAEAMRVREMFTNGPVVDRPWPNTKVVT